MNTDYKIVEKAIANKILPTLEHIIHQDQRGFMKNRRISVNIRKMLDIIHYANKEDLEAVVLSLDFVKCFDKCSFSILHGSLEYFGFGEVVKEWTKILYKNFSVKVQNNGHFSENIDINKGVHQGGCCSSLYFLIIAEILAISLRADERIEGITISTIRNLLNQFADDMDIFSLCSQQSLSAIFFQLDAFKRQSGFTVSYDKTTLYRIGSLRFSSAEMYDTSQVTWSNQDIKVLGVTITHEDLCSKNYDELIEKSKQVLNTWNNRGLSLLGKVQIVNTLVASLFVYKMMVLPIISTKVIKQMENIIRDYLWQGKKAKIAYRILQLPKDQGGLNLVDLKRKDMALKSSWPKILADKHQYSRVVYSLMRCSALGADIWRCSIAPEDISVLPCQDEFWSDVLLSWSQYNYFYEKSIENQFLWYNSAIQFKGKPFFWKDAYDRGLRFVHQLFEEGGYKSLVKIQEEFGISVLRYNSLKAAVPREWRNFFTLTPLSTFCPLIPSNYDSLVCRSGGESFTRKVYKYMADDVFFIRYKCIKWREELQDLFFDDILNFAKLFRNIYRITNVPKLRSFQYRLLQRGIVTNVQLAAWKITTSPDCYFCHQSQETLTHLFCSCQVVQDFWQGIIEWMQDRFGVKQQEITLSPTSIISNLLVPGVASMPNVLCLLAKQYIYRQRCQKGNLSIAAFKRYVQNIENMEKYISIKNDKYSTHLKKWSTEQMYHEGSPIMGEYIERYIDMLED